MAIIYHSQAELLQLLYKEDKVGVTQKYGGNFRLPNGNWAYAVMHGGVDTRAAVGTPLYAPFDCEVKSSDLGNRDYGKNLTLWAKNISITDGDRVWHECKVRIGHLSEFLVKDGFVKKGAKIALTGNTGFSNSPHLHTELIPYQDGNRAVMNKVSGRINPESISFVKDVFKEAKEWAEQLKICNNQNYKNAPTKEEFLQMLYNYDQNKEQFKYNYMDLKNEVKNPIFNKYDGTLTENMARIIADIGIDRKMKDQILPYIQQIIDENNLKSVYFE